MRRWWREASTAPCARRGIAALGGPRVCVALTPLLTWRDGWRRRLGRSSCKEEVQHEVQVLSRTPPRVVCFLSSKLISGVLYRGSVRKKYRNGMKLRSSVFFLSLVSCDTFASAPDESAGPARLSSLMYGCTDRTPPTGHRHRAILVQSPALVSMAIRAHVKLSYQAAQQASNNPKLITPCMCARACARAARVCACVCPCVCVPM